MHKRHCYYSMHRSLSIQIKKNYRVYKCQVSANICMFRESKCPPNKSDKLSLGGRQCGSRPAISPFSHSQRCTLSRQLIVKLQQADRRGELNNTNINDLHICEPLHISHKHLACAKFTLHQTNTYMGWWHHVVHLRVMLRTVVAIDWKFIKDRCR